MQVKQFKTSTGQDLPKPINWLVNKEHERLGYFGDKDSDLLANAFNWLDSNVFNGNEEYVWMQIYKDNFQPFYDQFPICKNSKGQILPDDIQIEIIEERLRQGDNKTTGGYLGFVWKISAKGQMYWNNIYHHSDYSTQSDEFTQGEIVEVTDYQENDEWQIGEYITNYKDKHVCYHSEAKEWAGWKYIRKPIPITEYTIDQLIEIVSKAEGKPVKLKV